MGEIQIAREKAEGKRGQATVSQVTGKRPMTRIEQRRDLKGREGANKGEAFFLIIRIEIGLTSYMVRG